jgi:hypothetical protein
MSATNQQQAQGIMISEALPDDVNLDELLNYDEMGEGEFAEWLDVPGKFLAKLTRVYTQDDGNHTPSENLVFQIVGGTVEGQKNKLFMERIYHGFPALKRSTNIAKRMDVWTEEQNEALKETIRSGEPAAGPEFTPCVDKSFVIDIKADEHNGKTQLKMHFMGIWSADDPRVADFVTKVNAGITPSAEEKTETKKEPAKQTTRTTTATQKGKAGGNAAGAATTKAGKGQAAQAPAGDVDDL